MSLTWQEEAEERDRRETRAVLRGLLWGLICSAPLWALVIWEVRIGVLHLWNR